jgi:hypothetical protein
MDGRRLNTMFKYDQVNSSMMFGNSKNEHVIGNELGNYFWVKMNNTGRIDVCTVGERESFCMRMKRNNNQTESLAILTAREH